MTPAYPRIVLSGLVVVFIALSTACSSSNDDDDMADLPCAEDNRADSFVEDMQKTGTAGLAIFTLHSIAPNPPDIGENDWNLSVEAVDDGSPLATCSVDIRPWMPDHEHGSNHPSGSEGEADSYDVAGMLFIMPGYWENTVTIDCAPSEEGDDPTALTDSAVFGFCVEG
jgi:hypothetical protein